MFESLFFFISELLSPLFNLPGMLWVLLERFTL